jgi:hypothetical protein
MALFWFVMIMSARQEQFTTVEENLFKKNLLIENFNRLRLNMGDHVFNNVLIGKDGWMEYTAGTNLDDYQNVFRLSGKSLRRIGRNIRSCYKYAQEQDITFLIVVAPNKATIYPDKLPDQIQPLADQSRLDRLNEYLAAHNIPQVLDLRPALLAARQERDVYYSLGTHWNEWGAYVGYETILDVLSQAHPEIVPYPEDFFRFSDDSELLDRRGDKQVARLIQANYLSMEPSLFATRDVSELVHRINLPDAGSGFHRMTWTSNSDLPTLMFFHDSFALHGLSNFLSLNFSKISYIRYQASHQYLNRDTIEMFAPDIVLYEVVERNLHALEDDLLGCAAE